MDFERWIDGYKVRVCPWIDGKNYYVNVQYYKPGASLSQRPAMEKTAYITKNASGENIIRNYLSTLTQYIAQLNIPVGGMAQIAVE